MKPYVPHRLPLADLDWTELIPLIGNARAALAQYDGLLRSIPNSFLMLKPLTTQEAVLSSRIEGTQTTVQEVLEFEIAEELEGTSSRSADIQEVANYRKALIQGLNELKKRPMSLNMIRRIHDTLLDSVRGDMLARRKFRTTQNYIALPGASINEASYIPPEPSVLMEHLSAFEKYLHYEEKDRLVQAAIMHAQFEIIHPFIDGNGRVGRILIPLFFYEKQLLSEPIFSLSSYLEAERDEYYARLRAITAENDWTQWIQFFLTAVTKQAAENSDKAERILRLYDKMKAELPQIIRSQYAIQALDALFRLPVFWRSKFGKEENIPSQTASRIVKELERENIVLTVHQSRGRRSSIVIFPALLSIVDDRASTLNT